MRILARLFSLRRFRRDERGTLSVETAMFFPLLIFTFVGIYTFFDGFRTQNINVRASYTIADMLSRETNMIDDDYIEGLNKVLGLLTKSDYETILRITVVTMDAHDKTTPDDDEYQLVWSEVEGGTGQYVKALTPATLSTIEDRIPIMDHGDINIVVETWSGFVPIFDFGIDPYYFEHLVVTRPRFGPQLCWESC